MAEVQQREEICKTEEVNQLKRQNKEMEERFRAMQDEFKNFQIREQAVTIKCQAATIECQAAKIIDQVEINRLKDENIRLKDENIQLKDEIIERDRIQRDKDLENERVLNELIEQLRADGATGVGPQLPNDPADTKFDSALRRMKKLYGQASENKIYVIGGVVIGIVGCALFVYGGSAVYSYLLTFGAKEVPQSYFQLSSAVLPLLLRNGWHSHGV